MQSLSCQVTDPSSCLLKYFLMFLRNFEPTIVKIIEKMVESSFVCIDYKQEHNSLFTFEEFDLVKQIDRINSRFFGIYTSENLAEQRLERITTQPTDYEESICEQTPYGDEFDSGYNYKYNIEIVKWFHYDYIFEVYMDLFIVIGREFIYKDDDYFYDDRKFYMDIEHIQPISFEYLGYDCAKLNQDEDDEEEQGFEI
jgi:hypothetical protein